MQPDEKSLLASGRLDEVMAIPNVKRFRPFCPTCDDNFTLMAVLPRDADVAKYLSDAVARHDHKVFQEAKTSHVKVRVGQQKQKKAK
jgi:hypothetical protein